MVDFKKLSKVSDSLFREGKTIEINEEVQIEDEKSPLDSIKVETKIKDKKRIQDSNHDKVLILDDVQIKSIMESSRDKRRAVLSKLSDSQRKRVLSRYLELKKVKDDNSVSKLEVLNLDNLASNYLFSPTDYNKSLLQEGLNTYGVNLEEKYRDFIEVLLSDGTAQPKYENEVQDWMQYCNSLGINSELGNVFELLESNTDDVLLEDSEVPADLNEATQETYTEDELMSDDNTVLADCVQKKFGLSIKQIKDSKIIDDYVTGVLDKIEEKPFIDEDGNEVVPVEERPLLQVLTEALVDYQNGEPEKLEALAQAPVAEEKEESEEEEKEDKEKEDITEEEGEPVDISSDITVEDSVKLAKAILEKNYKIYDSYRGIHPILDGFFDEFIDHVEDVDAPEDKYDYFIEHSEYDPNVSVTEIPLTRDEFCASYQTPTYFRNLCAECGCEVPEVSSYEFNGPCVSVNGECSYYPYNCSIEELKEELENPEADIQKIIGSSCVTLADACRLAAKTDNLNIIDNKFYKKSLSSKDWCYDSLPSILKKCGVTKPSGTIHIADYDNGQDDNLDLFGTKYVLG